MGVLLFSKYPEPALLYSRRWSSLICGEGCVPRPVRLPKIAGKQREVIVISDGGTVLNAIPGLQHLFALTLLPG